MGGKSKQSQRTKNNARPSSSGRSAELLNNAVRIDPSLVTGSGKVLPVLFPTLAAPLDIGLNPDLTLCLKKLNKKDPITKTKALQELTELVKKGNVEDVVAALPAWAHYYRILTTDTDHKVREATQVAHGAIVWACGRRIAPQLKRLVPPWLQAQYDEHAPAAAAARASLATTFPESKLPDVISFCMTEVIAHLLEYLVGNAESALSKKMLTPEEKELQHARLVTASLQGLEYFVQHLPAAHDAWLWGELAPLLQAGGFWKLANHKSPQIKTSWYGALGRIITRFKDTFGAAYGQKTGKLLLSGAGGAQLWTCLLVLMHHVKDWHTWLDKKELLIKRITDILENGGWGDAKHLSSMLLPLLAYLPEQMLTKEFYESFFCSVFKGLEKKAVISSKSERQSWITGLSECMRYLTVQEKDYAVEVATTVHRTWLEFILLNPYDSQTTNNLIKHSAANMVALVKYWLKQSKEDNGDKYDQLVRNFWQNVASTMVAQIDKLSTDHKDITNLIENHTLLLQSLKSLLLADAKKSKSIKFKDEQQVETEESEESTPQCDASIVDRYNHNLDEVVQKICAHYFEFANKKQVANYVFSALLTLVIEFGDKNLFMALARHFNADSVYGLYDKVLRDWLAGDTMRCKPVADIVFLSMKHMTEKEQEAMLNSFKQFPPSVVEWCISLSLSHPHCLAPAVRRWLRGDLVESTILAVCRRMIDDDDSKSRSLLLMCLAHDEDGEVTISSSAVARVVELVSAALAAAPAPERLAGAACALASELGACPALALALLRLQLAVPRGSARLPAEAWLELRAAWQDAGAAAPSFRARAAAALRAARAASSDTLDIQHIEHVVSLCPYLLPRFGDGQVPDDASDAAAVAALLLSAPSDAIQTHALRHDCMRSNLNCPFDDDNDFIRRVVAESSTEKIAELTREEALAYSNEALFRASLVRALAAHGAEGEAAWCGELFKEKYFQEQFASVMRDYAVVSSLAEGYAFWPHYPIISLAKTHLTSTIDDVIEVMPTHTRSNMLTHLSELAATEGYYWSYAWALFKGKAREGDRDMATSETEQVNLEEVVTGNGFFHTLQADTKSSTDVTATLRAKYLVMMRSFFLAYAPAAPAAPAAPTAPAAPAAPAVLDTARCGPDAVIDAYYRQNLTMLFDCDIAAAEWRQVVSSAAVAEYLAAMVEAHAWDAPAAHWDFATIALCSLTASLLKSVDRWGSPKVALLARSTLALHGAVQAAALALPAQCERLPAPHVAALPDEWRDIFAPDLTHNLLRIVLAVLETRSPEITSPQAAFLSALLPVVRSLDWRRLPAAQQARLPAALLLARAAAALEARAHFALQYLAHALLGVVGEPLVLADAETLAAHLAAAGAGAGAGAEEEEEAERVPLALAALLPPLARLQELVDLVLAPFTVGEECCELEPFTDSYSLVLGCLLLADATFTICQLARGDLTHHYLELFRESQHAELLIAACLRLLPRAVAAHALRGAAPAACAPLFLAPAGLRVDGDCDAAVQEPPAGAGGAGAGGAGEGAAGRLACRGLWQAARWAGGAARGWRGAAPARAARALERVLRAHVSPALCREQLAGARAGAAALPAAAVTVRGAGAGGGEVQCACRVDERRLRLSVALAADHPLTPPRLDAPAPYAAHWLAVYLAYQNGTVINALRMWIDTVARRVQASPQCYICYCRLHPATGRLPRVACHQCRNKFHANCLRKWFSSSSKSNCPLCRATF